MGWLQVLLLILGIIILTGIFVFFAVVLIVKLIYPKKYRLLYGRKVRHLAVDNDYYLINDFAFATDDNNKIKVDQLLFGERYIYVISPQYYPGVLKGEIRDISWEFFAKGEKSRRAVLANPIVQNQKRIEKLTLFTGIDRALFVSIVVFNNNAYLKDIRIDAPAEFVINLKDLRKTIEAIEKRPIAPIDPRSLEKAVQDIAKLKASYQQQNEKKGRRSSS